MANNTNIKKLVEEFYAEREKVEQMHVRQAKELQSMQNAIRNIAVTQKLSNEEKLLISDVIGITDEWWCNE